MPQLEGGLAYLAALGGEPCVAAALEAASGVGVVVTAERVTAAVAAALAADAARVAELRYRTPPGPLLAAARAAEPWADARAVKAELEAQLAALLGPRTPADDAPPEPKAKQPPAAAAAAAAKQAPAAAAATAAAGAAAAADAPPPASPADVFAFLPPPCDNFGVHTEVPMSDGSVLRPCNTRATLAAHLALTGGRVVTRFPPEPNGYLHIGHAKAMFVDFGSAAAAGGGCYLRFDDTNPEAEKLEYIEHIQEIVAWMGWTPARVTYASDYFGRLYDLAVELIRRGGAYVCHQTGDQIRASREARAPSPWRDRPPAESLALFDQMRRGLWDEGGATLRMRQDPGNANYNMFDLVAYRIKYAPHPHAGDAWCVYPSYDYTHCVNDRRARDSE